MIKQSFIKNKIKLLGLFFINLINIIIIIIQTYLLGIFINNLITKKNFDSVLKISIALTICTLLSIFLKFISDIYNARVQADIVYKINSAQLRHIKKLPLLFFNQVEPVYLNQRINNDSNVVTNFWLNLMVKGSLQIISILIIFLVFFKMNINVFFVSIVNMFLFFIIYKSFAKKLYAANKIFSEQQNKLFSEMNNHLFNIKHTKINMLYEYLDKKLNEASLPFFAYLNKYINISYIFSSVSDMSSNFFNIFLYIYCGYAIYNNKMNIGEFIMIKNFQGFMLESFSNVIILTREYPNMLVSRDRLNEIELMEQEANGTRKINSIDKIILDKVYFSYSDKNIIENFSYVFEKGHIYLIQGDNGSGKTTLIEVLLGLYGNFSGNIFYNDYSLKDINIYLCRSKCFSIVEQHPVLLYDDLDMNLYCIEKKQEVYNLLDYFNLSYINEKYCKSLSGGEKQKVAISMALAKETDVLILDEPTSALDKESKEKFFTLISNNKKTKIIIIISHDKDLTAFVDKVVRI
ncbi:ATP-binding cassette domain-containing protein [Vagococcus fluvialis]|uniref:Manganese ABC transporter, ATP-binding protein SitB n=1 Tax=Vagococcus fluvialis bH819 TaxID=1255619 RepID=A0A1X6WP41_9ENTE|nr:ABC transporter ATP-binding protein [Vagococcus fluvialis]SLM85992.1 Manganese ABC transporter, ATP-binding protein SitB [Vagococcus fluvialis bH819]